MATDIPASMNLEQFNKSCFEGLLQGAMGAAVRDYVKEVKAEERANAGPVTFQTDADDLLDGEDDPELEALHRRRLEKLKKTMYRKQVLLRKGHGEYREIDESQFLKEVTGAKFCVVHFYHPDFPRCKIMDKHLDFIAKKYIPCKFMKMNADKCPFFVGKLQVQTLPAVLMFIDGVCKDRCVGFDELGGKDTFPTRHLEARLHKGKVIKYRENFREEEDEEDEDEVRDGTEGLRSGREVDDGYDEYSNF